MATAVDDGSGRIPEVPLFEEDNQLVNFLSNIFGRSGSSSSTSTSDIGPGGQDAFQQFMAQLMPDLQSDAYSPQRAEMDAKALVEGIFKNYRESSLPEIYQAQGASGGYNSTTGQLLANDAFARASAQGAQAVAKTKLDYAGIRQRNMTMFQNAVIAMINGSRRTATNTQQNTGALSPNAQKAALAAKAAQALAGKPSKAKPQKPKANNSDGANDGLRGLSDDQWLDATRDNFLSGLAGLDEVPVSSELQALLDAGTDAILGQGIDSQLLAESTMPNLDGLDMGLASDDPFTNGDFGGLGEGGDNGLGGIPDDLGDDGSDAFPSDFGDFDFGEPMEEIPDPAMDEMEDFDFSFGDDFSDLGDE